MRLKYIFVLLVAVLFALPLPASSQDEFEKGDEYTDPNQPQIDSLLSLIKPDSPDSIKAKYYCMVAGKSVLPDTITKYANFSLNYCEETDYLNLARNNYYLGMVSRYNNNEFGKALPFYQKYIYYATKYNDPQIIAEAYQHVSFLYDDMKKIDSAIFYMNKALEIGIRLNDTAFIADCYLNLGVIYGDRGMFIEAGKYYRQSIALDSLSGNLQNYAIDLLFFADLMMSQNPDSLQTYYKAKDFLTKAESLLDTIEIDEKYFIYADFSSIYIFLARKTNEKMYADSCLYYYLKAEKFIRTVSGITNYNKLQYIYVDYLLFNKKYREALNIMLSLKENLNEESRPLDYAEFHEKFRDIYIALGDYKHAYTHSEKMHEYLRININDSTMSALSDVKAQQVSIMEKLQREKDEEVHAAEKQKMRIVILSLIGGLLLVSLLVFYVFRVLKIKKKANADLLEKNAILIEQKEEISAQRDEIEEQKEEIEAQRDEIMAQRDTIKAQSDEIQASINYARRIQCSLLTPAAIIDRIFPEHFLLYKPRNVVSGDYYWVGQFGDNKVCIVADSTGHGVPGGFMSVLGMSNLNHIVAQNISPDVILNSLRESIISNLRQKNDAHIKDESEIDSTLDRISDGMDVAAYVVNERQMKLSYAGANNSLVLIRGNETQVLKADRMPVGIYARMAPFQCTTIDLQKGDCLYTFSDGFQDQFSNGTYDKFTSKRLRGLLLEIHERPMNEQKDILNRTFEKWRGPAENQTDDVVIMGVRIG